MDYAQARRWLDGHLDHESSSLGVAAGRIEGLSLVAIRELMALLGIPRTPCR
ncbi:MAG: hypothetical protein M5U19_23290 [Microthrixaceae bacterium]|nr:hypothetical protein [Microthrixaceae bacterium]